MWMKCSPDTLTVERMIESNSVSEFAKTAKAHKSQIAEAIQTSTYLSSLVVLEHNSSVVYENRH
mgnify:FL=1